MILKYLQRVEDKQLVFFNLKCFKNQLHIYLFIENGLFKLIGLKFGQITEGFD